MILVRKLIMIVILDKIFCTKVFLNEKCGMFDYHKKYDIANLQCLPDAFLCTVLLSRYIINNISNDILKVRTLPLLYALRSL